MNIINFFKETDAPRKRIMLMAALSGVANGMLLVIINVSVEQIVNDEVEIRLAFLYFLSFGLFMYTKRYALTQATIAVENVIRHIRIRIADKIRHSELRFIETIGFSNMYEPLSKDTNLIAQTAIGLVMSGQSIIVLIFSSLYLAFISPLSLWITLTFITCAIILYLSYHKEISLELQQASEQETKFFSTFEQIRSGFKEIKINHKKNNDVFQHLSTISKETSDLKIAGGLRAVTTMMFGQISFYLLLAVLVFILPIFSPTEVDDLFKIIATILFIIGPVGQFTDMMPMTAKADIAVTNLYRLEKILDKEREEPSEAEFVPPITKFEEIRLKDLNFHYRDAANRALFSINGINLTIQQGELLFVVGGNGSGKSTLLKLLSGLYYPETGDVYIDNKRMDIFNYQNYRELFSIIFTDFHLFDRIYGIDEPDDTRINELLHLVELDKKVQYRDGKFSNLDLSTGQKKRLAFITAVLEDKPIYIFDELAADQDPLFRKRFYEKILPGLQEQGKTIIAVTHDDHYFHLADRIMKMEYGKLIEFNGYFE